MAALTVGVLRESAPGEQRVALVPEAAGRLVAAGLTVLVEAGAGQGAWHPDEAYVRVGATVVPLDELVAADVVLTIGPPAATVLRRLHSGQVLIGLLQPLLNLSMVRELADAGVTAISLDGLPRTLSRAQAMDALTSQANVAGYKAVLVAATAFARFFPMLITAAGTARPARVLVLGTGIAGLQAIGTARRLGAAVTGYDVRPSSRDEVASLGAEFLVLKSVADAAGEGGYARALTAGEQEAQQHELNDHVARYDIVITTAQVPGRRPPLLVSTETVKCMRPGSVLVDLAASSLGGNVELSEPDATVVTDNGVTVIGAPNLPATVPAAASDAYSRNISALLLHFVSDDGLQIDLSDEISAGVVITHGGKVVHPGTAALLTS